MLSSTNSRPISTGIKIIISKNLTLVNTNLIASNPIRRLSSQSEHALESLKHSVFLAWKFILKIRLYIAPWKENMTLLNSKYSRSVSSAQGTILCKEVRSITFAWAYAVFAASFLLKNRNRLVAASENQFICGSRKGSLVATGDSREGSPFSKTFGRTCL